MKVSFVVLGEPKGKGRPQFSTNKYTGKAIARTPQSTVLYENLVVTEYNRQVGMKFDDYALLDMRVICYYPITKSVSKKKRELMLKGKIRPTKKPDVDNVVKVIADSLNNVAYRDDKQIVDCSVSKFYSERPRVEISIEDTKECEARAGW